MVLLAVCCSADGQAVHSYFSFFILMLPLFLMWWVNTVKFLSLRLGAGGGQPSRVHNHMVISISVSRFTDLNYRQVANRCIRQKIILLNSPAHQPYSWLSQQPPCDPLCFPCPICVASSVCLGRSSGTICTQALRSCHARPAHSGKMHSSCSNCIVVSISVNNPGANIDVGWQRTPGACQGPHTLQQTEELLDSSGSSVPASAW